MNFVIRFLQNFVDAIEFLRVPIFRKIQFVYTHQSAQVDIQKEKISFGTRFCGTQSLVCYTFVPMAVKRMSVALHDSRLFSGAEQADKFREEQGKFVFSDCSEKEQTVYKNPRRSGKLSAIVAKKRLEKIYFLQIIELSVAEIQNADLYFRNSFCADIFYVPKLTVLNFCD